MSQSLGKKLQKLTQEYGIAWFVVNQALGWLTYFMIYFVLISSRYDVVEILSQNTWTKGVMEKVGPTAGNMAIAFALNRLGTPVRVILTTYLMKYTATPINAKVNPMLKRLGFPTLAPVLEDFPGVENESDAKKND